MPESINCRIALESDINFIYSSLVEMAVEENIEQRFHMSESELFDCLFGASKLAEVIVAEINHKLAGLIMFSETNRNFTLFKKPGIYVHDIYVLPAYRKKRIANHLSTQLRKLAIERDYGRIDWVVLSDNELGQEFFRHVPDAIKVDYIQYMRINLA